MIPAFVTAHIDPFKEVEASITSPKWLEDLITAIRAEIKLLRIKTTINVQKMLAEKGDTDIFLELEDISLQDKWALQKIGKKQGISEEDQV